MFSKIQNFIIGTVTLFVKLTISNTSRLSQLLLSLYCH